MSALWSADELRKHELAAGLEPDEFSAEFRRVAARKSSVSFYQTQHSAVVQAIRERRAQAHIVIAAIRAQERLLRQLDRHHHHHHKRGR